MSEHKCCVCNRWKSSEYISEKYVNESDTICKKCGYEGGDFYLDEESK